MKIISFNLILLILKHYYVFLALFQVHFFWLDILPAQYKLLLESLSLLCPTICLFLPKMAAKQKKSIFVKKTQKKVFLNFGQSPTFLPKIVYRGIVSTDSTQN